MARSALLVAVVVLDFTLPHHILEVHTTKTPPLSGPPPPPYPPSSASLREEPNTPPSLTLEHTRLSVTLEQAQSSLNTPLPINKAQTRALLTLEQEHSSLKTPFSSHLGQEYALLTLKQGKPSLRKPSSMSLEQAVVDVAQGPLRENWIVIMMDSSADELFSICLVLETLHRNDNPSPLFLVRPEKDPEWQHQFQSSPSIFYSGRCVLILIIGSWVDWLEEQGEEAWTPPATLIVVNVNTSWDATLLMELPLIQRSASLALLQEIPTDGIPSPYLFTSKYFSKTPHEQLLPLDLLGLWDKTRFPTHDDVFPDRFQTFSGEVLHVASDLDDLRRRRR